MSVVIPIVTSRNNQRVNLALDGLVYLWDIHWNVRDNAWYFDLREGDETLIIGGVKIVLGASLGSTSTHPFFSAHLVTATDTTGSGRDAGYDDLGDRVQLIMTSVTDTPQIPS